MLKFVNRELHQNLLAVLPERISEFQSCRSLISRLKWARRTIRHYYYKIIVYNKISVADQFIADNYPAIDKAVGTLIRSFKNVVLPSQDKRNFPDWFIFIRTAIFERDFKFTTESMIELIEIFQHCRPLTNSEYDFMLPMLKSASIVVIAEAIRPTALAEDKFFVKNAMKAFFATDDIDDKKINDNMNSLEQILRTDPANIYVRQNDRTRALYRYRVAKAAYYEDINEIVLAKNLIFSAQMKGNIHVGGPIFDHYEKVRPKNPIVHYYFKLLFFLPVVFSILLSCILGNIMWCLLLFLPCYEICRPIIERFALKGSEITYAPRLDFDGKVPKDCKTLVTLSTLLPKEKDMPKLEERLVELLISSMEDNCGVCLLADLPPSKKKIQSDDEKMLCVLEKMIIDLNNKYQNKLVCLVRQRNYSKTGKEYSGFERKRGAISALAELIDGKEQDFLKLFGNKNLIHRTRYILALDFDTGLTMDCLPELISIAAHPMNQPIIDKSQGIVTHGYGIFIPRIVTDLESSMKTPFSKIMCGVGGVSSYDVCCSELYQDLFGEGIFTGKGLIDVYAYNELLKNVFEEETVLSHDILEGSILRTMFVGDVELTDGFPKDGVSFFKRMHRWIRGDFQNTPFLFPMVPLYRGTASNPLNKLSRFKLFDNLRRALTPFIGMLCVFAALLFKDGRAAVLFAAGILSVIFPYIYSIWRMVISGALSSLTRRFYSGILSKFGELFVRIIFIIMLLPQFAYISVDGAVRGLYRRYVSKQKLLEWTTAAQSEVTGSKSLKVFIYYLSQLIAGLIFVFMGQLFLKLCGLLFISAVPVMFICSRSSSSKFIVSSDIRIQLLEDLSKMLAFYEDYATSCEHYLPPDNMQISPTYFVAHRTSPTNIGMMLLTYLTARDCGLITTARLFEIISRVISTVETLPKFHGNLYNWYDTENLSILRPGFVSTVDSGNFACCLVALNEGLKDYIKEEGAINNLLKRIDMIIKEIDLSVFYDSRRNLFFIGWDSETSTLNSSHYDMLMSEARMTSFFAIARKQVPVRHWTSLSRAMSVSGLHAGLLAWTGTMFEYYMPELLLPSMKGSIGYESLEYCLHCQKKRAEYVGEPWGISESAIYSFDACLNYRYSPNGVQKLALKRGMDETYIAAPYATYLTLLHDIDGATENLKKLRELGCYGKYGFYESIDFTRSRIGESRFEVVKSFMSHHIGMSAVSIGNVINYGIMQKRFLRNIEMHRAQSLLNEKISEGEFVFEDWFKKKRRETIKRVSDEYEYVGHLLPQDPRVKLLSNSDITSVLTDVGASYLRCGRIDITRRPSDLLRAPIGTFAFLKVGGEIISLTFAPSYRNDILYETAFSSSGVIYTSQHHKISSRMEVRVHRNISVEQRIITIKNRTNMTQEMTLLIYTEPLLYPRLDDNAHKAFSKLFIEPKYDSQKKAAIVTRRKRECRNERSIAMGFLEDAEFDFISSREDIFARNNIQIPKMEAFTMKPEQFSASLPDPCAAFRVSFNLQKNETYSLTFLTSVAATSEEALNGLSVMRTEGEIPENMAARSRLVCGSLAHRAAQTILPQVLFNKPDSDNSLAAVAQNTLPKTALWRFGISADFPIVLCDIYSAKDTGIIDDYASCYAAFRLSFVEYDLVFLYGGAPDTLETIKSRTALKCGEGVFHMRAGIHIINRNEISPQEKNLLYAVACHIAPQNPVRKKTFIKSYRPISICPSKPVQFHFIPDVSVTGGAFVKDSFFVTDSPLVPWCHVLANPTFGTLLSDKALGFTWAINSRENKLTPWYNDALQDNVGEMLLLKTDGMYYDLVNGSTAEFKPGTAQYHGSAGEFSTNVSVFVPAKGMIKYIDITLENTSDMEKDVSLCYYIEPCLGVTREDSCQIIGKIVKNALLLYNPYNSVMKSYMALSADGESFNCVCDRPAFLSGIWNKNTLPPFNDLCAAIIVKKKIAPHRKVFVRFMMSFSTAERGAIALLQRKPRDEYHAKNKIQVNTGDKSLDVLINTWLPWQIVGSRIFARTGFYQNGGAYGFRDQLQDVCSYLLLSPNTARVHILRCCAVQFEEGDVMHWWHVLPKSSCGTRGVRTRYSDDMIWLPYAVCRYVECTGDTSVLDVKVPYLKAEELAEGQNDNYIRAEYSDCCETVYDHCKRALSRALSLGEHGMPKIGGGDWNDGYNNVGVKGLGESVWLAQFLAIVMKKMETVCWQRGDDAAASSYAETSAKLLDAVDASSWDGEWYLRAFYDNGQVMGSKSNSECSIDSLTQSFAVLAGMSDASRCNCAMKSAFNMLVDKEHSLIKLFTPEFNKSSQEPGYIKAYPPGVRENGGQYTHASIWLAIAACENNMPDMFFTLTDILNPIKRCMNPKHAKIYNLEPYWLAGDISSNKNICGRGGWSMYTGAAGWYYRLLVEYLLGLRFRNGKLFVKPCLPKRLLGSRVEVNCFDKVIKISLNRSFRADEPPSIISKNNDRNLDIY